MLTTRNMTEYPTTVYSPASPVKHPIQLILALWHDILAARELAWRLFVRDLTAQYRQTYLGYIWAFLPPLFASFTFIYLNQQGIVHIEGTKIPYPAFAMIGTLLWQIFVDALQCPTQAINNSKNMLSKINFPREALLIGGLYMVLFNLSIRILLLIAVLCYWKITIGALAILFPIAMISLLLAGLAVGMAILPLSTLYGDISRGLPLLIQFWMLLTPVVYPPKTGGLAGFLSTWNPISPLITTAREAICNQTLTLLLPFITVSIISIFIVFIGLLTFRLIMPLIIERIGG